MRPEPLPEPQKPLKSALKRPAPQPAPSVPRRKDAPARRNSFDEDDSSDEPQFVGTIAAAQKKVKSELRPDYLLRAEELKQKRLQELQHSFEDDRGFVLTPLGVPQNVQKAMQTTITTTQKKGKSARRLSSSSADDDLSEAHQGVSFACGGADDDDFVPAFDDDFVPPASPARPQRSSTDSTSNEDSDAEESSRRSKAAQSRSPPKKSTATSAESDWSFLSTSKRAAASSATVAPLSLPPQPLSLPPEPLRLPPAKPAAPTMTQMMVPMAMPTPAHIPVASQQLVLPPQQQQPLLPMHMQMQMQMPGAPMMWPHAMYSMGVQMGMQMAQHVSMQHSPISFPTQSVPTPTITTTARTTAAAAATATVHSSFPFQPAELSSSFPSPIASSPMPDPRVEELEDAPF